MSDGLMLEASMLLHSESANYLLYLAANDTLEAVVSDTFLRVAESDPEQLRRLAVTLEIPQEALDLTLVKELLQQPGIQTYRIPENSSVWNQEDSSRFRATLVDLTGDDLVAQIFYEEWYFMMSESWVFSKTRRAFDAMVEAGGTAVHLSQRVFDTVVRRTLKKKPGEPLTPSDKLKATAKWVAVGGAAVVGVLNPVAAVLGSAATGWFFLVDP